MSAALSTPSVRAGLFPPPCAPLRFADGDLYEWPLVGDSWVRTDGEWTPSPDDGSGHLTDAEVRASLHRAAIAWGTTCRFVPALPGARLPGRPILALPTTHNAAQYVLDHQEDRLVPVRDLVAVHDEDAAYDVPGVITASATAQVLSGIVTEHDPVRVRYDQPAGRIYVRYQRPNDFGAWGGEEFAPPVECLHVFVLTDQGA